MDVSERGTFITGKIEELQRRTEEFVAARKAFIEDIKAMSLPDDVIKTLVEGQEQRIKKAEEDLQKLMPNAVAAFSNEFSMTKIRDLYKEIIGPQDEYEENLRALDELTKRVALSQEQYNDALMRFRIQLLSARRDELSGLERGLLEFQQSANDMSSNMANWVTGSFNKMSDALVSFVQTGKFEFRSLILSIMADLMKLALQRYLFSAIADGLTQALGGGVPTGGGLPADGGASWFSGPWARASGGPVMGGQGYLVGEKGPEWFTPNSSGTIIPNNMLGGGGGVQVNINIDLDGANGDEQIRKMVRQGMAEGSVLMTKQLKEMLPGAIIDLNDRYR